MSVPSRHPCPDPHAPSPDEDRTLRALEAALGDQITLGVSGGIEHTDVRRAVRDYVAYLKTLDCAPEAVIVHVKRVIGPFGPASWSGATPEWDGYLDLQRRVVLMCIEEYFADRPATS